MPNPTSNTLPDGPWLITLEPFIRDEECNRLIQLSAAEVAADMKSPRTWVPKSSNVSLKASPTTTTTGLLPMPDGASKNVSMTHRRAEYVVGGGIENAAGGR